MISIPARSNDITGMVFFHEHHRGRGVPLKCDFTQQVLRDHRVDPPAELNHLLPEYRRTHHACDLLADRLATIVQIACP